MDTSAWLALNDRNDQYYKQSAIKISLVKKQKIELVTSEYIFDESITLIRHRVSHRHAVIFGDSLLNSNMVEIVDVNADCRLKAWEMFKKYEDKELSFTDCTSFVLMKDMRLHKAFTFDEHFRQVGVEIF
ncbi:MAG: PIN domain-containing protein [Nitrospirota bacterium]